MKKWYLFKPKLVKPKFFLGTPLALFSLEIYFGAISGYFVGKFLSGKQAGQSGIIKSIILNIGQYRLHFHHWLYSLGILVLAIFYQFLPFPQFSFGFLGGLAFQGISCYSDWHKVLFRQKRV